ncbi:TRAP transporter small permease [Ornithinimicrobium faecis]|uniref:TRAP transporter small permease n=1 Tax=Ornithinimicrobium faecis TaxID=2934158 RepID=A0ABY4YWF4_9MICO|nr:MULTISPECIES: TRAP transporter small permease [unclassified Ornithinimicrobium]USQ81070.1 TRAP transporter small permease [Ornithinimicrobium sp. HY1793]
MTAPTPTASGARTLPRRLVRVLDLAEQTVGAICLGVILVLVSIQVVQRVTTGGSWVWSGEFAKYAMVWLTFILAAHLLRTDGHLKVDVIEQWLTPRGERIMTRITDGLIAVSCWGLVWAGWGLLTAPFLGSAPASGVPLVIVYAGPVVGLVLIALTATWFAIVGRSPEDQSDEQQLPEGVL